MNRIFNVLVNLALVFAGTALTSCSKGNVEPAARLVKFHDYLYGVEYDDYDFELANNYIDENYHIPQRIGCSQVRKGNFVGRNLDYYINSDLNAVIKVNRKGEPDKATVNDTGAFFTSRYASISVMGCGPDFTTEVVRNTTDYLSVYEALPIATLDGVNENGVYAALNMDATGETSMDRSQWNTGYFGLGAAYTNPSSELTFCTYILVRVVLDHAKSVDDAIRIVEAINWYDPLFSEDGESQSFHWIIADAKTNCILEFVDNKPVIIKTSDVSTPSLATIMTNFTNSLWQKDVIQNYGTGYERYDILAARYPDTPSTFEGMQNLMEYVWGSKCYTLSIDDPDFLATDQVSEYFTAAQLYRNPEALANPLFQEIYKSFQDDYNDHSTWYTPDCDVWITTHTSIYDLNTRTLKVKVNEGLDGMNDYLTFDLNSHFPNPIAR